jgi:class 3 adenylate cyclase
VPAAEEPAADGARTAGEALGWAEGAALCGVGTLATGTEAPQPAISVAARSSATPVAPAAQFLRRDPDIRGLWAKRGLRAAVCTPGATPRATGSCWGTAAISTVQRAGQRQIVLPVEASVVRRTSGTWPIINPATSANALMIATTSPTQLAPLCDTRDRHCGALADVRGSTSLGKRTSPTEFARLLNRCYEVATHTLVGHDAMIDKLIGDEVMAFFVRGISGPECRQRVVEAGTELLSAVAYGTPEGPWLDMGVAVNAGIAYVGKVGGAVVDFTTLGDTVNVAARMQGDAAGGELLSARGSARGVRQRCRVVR